MLDPWFDNRLLYMIVTTAISGYFNPTNLESYWEKKRKYAEYLGKPIVKKTLKTDNATGIGKQRQVILFYIKYRLFWALDILGKLGKSQNPLKRVKYKILNNYKEPI